MPQQVATAEEVSRLEQRIEAMNAQYERELAEQRRLVTEFLASLDDQVSTKKAQQITGIKSRATLIAKRQLPDSPLAYTVNGRSVTYSRAGCVAYKLKYQLGA